MEENRGLDMEERRGGRREFIWEKRREKEEEKKERDEWIDELWNVKIAVKDSFFHE